MQRVHKLADDVIVRIAAGEVVHRPANAVKELLENCLDAGATQVSIMLSEGGMKQLQITDNGGGIAVQDLPNVCQRYTTSKISAVGDLDSVRTFGFRGEALASVSHISHVTITSFPAHQRCAYKLSFLNSAPIPPGQWGYKVPRESKQAEVKARPCSGNKGTVILVEDLFYNVATRRKALTNASEEYNRCAEVVRCYAVANPSVALSVKKRGEATVSLQSRGSDDDISAIRQVFGENVARNLVPFDLNSGEIHDQDHFRARGWVTDVRSLQKSGEVGSNQFILFVNGRLVANQVLKRAIHQIYKQSGGMLGQVNVSKGLWTFMKIEVDPVRVDVNVHPAKEEVHILSQDDVIRKVGDEVRRILRSCVQSGAASSSPPVPYSGSGQMTLTQSSSTTDGSHLNQDRHDSIVSSAVDSLRVNANARYHPFDEDNQAGDFISTPREREGTGGKTANNSRKSEKRAKLEHPSSPFHQDMSASPRRHEQLQPAASIEGIRAAIDSSVDSVLYARFSSCEYVGTACLSRSSPEDDLKCHSVLVLQHGQSVFLVDCSSISREIVFQNLLAGLTEKRFVLARTREMNLDWLSNELDVQQLLMVALNSDRSGYSPEDGSRADIANGIRRLLVQHVSLMSCFGLVFVEREDTLFLQGLPRILHRRSTGLKKQSIGRWPTSALTHKIPFLMLELATRVEWPEVPVTGVEDATQSVIEDILDVLASFFSFDENTIAFWQSSRRSPVTSPQNSSDEEAPSPDAESTVHIFPASRTSQALEVINVFRSRNSRDNPLWRALDFLRQRRSMPDVAAGPEFENIPYLFRRVNDVDSAYEVTSPRIMFGDVVEQCDRSVLSKGMLQDLIVADEPVKLTLTGSCTLSVGAGDDDLVLSEQCESRVAEMVHSMKLIATSLFEDDAGSAAHVAQVEGRVNHLEVSSKPQPDSWLELDASTPLRDKDSLGGTIWHIRRHLVCADIVFRDVGHLRKFHERFEGTIQRMLVRSDPLAMKLNCSKLLGAEKASAGSAQFFFDVGMLPDLSLGGHRSARSVAFPLPWCAASRLPQHPYASTWLPVRQSRVQRGLAPTWRLFSMALRSCSHDGSHIGLSSRAVTPFAYESSALDDPDEPPSGPSLEGVMEMIILPILRSDKFVPSAELVKAGDVKELTLTPAKLQQLKRSCSSLPQ